MFSETQGLCWYLKFESIVHWSKSKSIFFFILLYLLIVPFLPFIVSYWPYSFVAFHNKSSINVKISIFLQSRFLFFFNIKIEDNFCDCSESVAYRLVVHGKTMMVFKKIKFLHIHPIDKLSLINPSIAAVNRSCSSPGVIGPINIFNKPLCTRPAVTRSRWFIHKVAYFLFSR